MRTWILSVCIVEDLITKLHLRKPVLLFAIGSWLAMMPTLYLTKSVYLLFPLYKISAEAYSSLDYSLTILLFFREMYLK